VHAPRIDVFGGEELTYGDKQENTLGSSSSKQQRLKLKPRQLHAGVNI
jgi:hypothetical protein